MDMAWLLQCKPSRQDARGLRAFVLPLLLPFLLLFFCGSALPANDTSQRIALVIGNASYPTAPLINTKNDAKAVAAMLGKLGFDVITVLDGTRQQIEESLARLSSRITDKTSALLIYYAGHGVQLENRNYIIPVNAALSSRQDIQNQAIDVAKAVAALKSKGGATHVIILDSCRNNPFGALGSGAGLTPMDAPAGTYIAFATAPGHVASDGAAADVNGVYTAALLKELAKPAGSIESIFKRVRFTVRQRTAGKQIPWESSSLEKDFYFSPAIAGQSHDELELFQAELAHWQRIAESSRLGDFYAYLQVYPSGFFAEQAQAALERISRGDGVRPLGAAPFSVVPADRPLFNVGDRFVYRTLARDGTPKNDRDLVVTAITPATVELNKGEVVWDWMGNLITDGTSVKITRSPAKVWIPAQLYIGKKWRTAYSASSQAGTSTLFWDFQVEALDELNTSAGKFKAYRVSGSSKVSTGASQTEKLWIDANTFLIVKDIWQRQRRVRGENRVEASYDRELVRLQRAPVR